MNGYEPLPSRTSLKQNQRQMETILQILLEEEASPHEMHGIIPALHCNRWLLWILMSSDEE